MNVDAESGGEKVSSRELERRAPDITIPVPAKTITDLESLACGFRMGMIELSADDEKIGEVTTGTGCGNDWINLEWKGKKVAIRGADLLKAFVEMVDPDEAPYIPNVSEKKGE